jgi:hypothetical protein
MVDAEAVDVTSGVRQICGESGENLESARPQRLTQEQRRLGVDTTFLTMLASAKTGDHAVNDRVGRRLPPPTGAPQYFRMTATTTPRIMTSWALAMIGDMLSLAGMRRILPPFSR